ncbi:MAG: response regulator transcription factor [Dehalococcoidales bacterium]|jgi:two-component system KDP operon response regulator KdpE|nr:response regulator transcription factor [Dehalococcoidales bacterium]
MKVVVIDDSPEIIEVVSLCFQLRWTDAGILSASTGAAGLELVEEESPDMVILDIGLPDMEGFDVLREIRRFSHVPVIMLTVRGEDIDVAKGLEMGADDYITKPFSHIELVARVQAVLRRSTGVHVNTAEEKPFSSGNISVDFAANDVRVDGKPVKLTSTERKLLYLLVRNEGRLLTHETLLNKIWGETYIDARDLLRVHIQHLRQKMGDNVESPNIILTEHGMGYKFIRPV